MAYGDGSTKLGSYTYDTAGNISSAVGDGRTISYTYDNTDWVDLLTSVTYNGTKKSITYDGSGNPTNWYNGTVYTALTWTQGRRLSSLKKGSTSISYAYDMDGVRTTKIAGNEKHEYVTQNGKVVRELVTNKTTGAFIRCLDFLYDESGKPFAMRRYWDASLSSYGTYHYVLNAQGDVVQINYQGGEVKATYTYDAWGRVLTADGELAAMNPIRYRGYYYDTDTGFYYLQSRYYDPIIKRFLNADSYESTGQGFIGTNMFAYCNNNPVKYIDFTGSLAIGIGIGIGIGIEEIIELVLGFTALCFGIAVIDEYTNSRGHSGTIVCSVQPIEEEKENVAVAEATSEPRIYSYWEAERVGNSVIVGRGLTLSEASLRIASGQNIMCRDKGAAKVILIVNNYSNAVGPEKHAENYYYHYHPNRHSHTHIWFYGEARDTRKKGNIYETIA